MVQQIVDYGFRQSNGIESILSTSAESLMPSTGIAFALAPDTQVKTCPVGNLSIPGTLIMRISDPTEEWAK